jgi:DnaK suppressor protein
MNQENQTFFLNLFIEMKKNILNEMKKSTSKLETKKGDEVDIEGDERNEALELKLQARQGYMLKKIDNALFKLKTGTYGICEECDGEIEFNRLKARPVATQCIVCKEAEERQEENMLYDRRSHTHGKTFFQNVVSLNEFRETQDAKIIRI